MQLERYSGSRLGTFKLKKDRYWQIDDNLVASNMFSLSYIFIFVIIPILSVKDKRGTRGFKWGLLLDDRLSREGLVLATRCLRPWEGNNSNI